MRLARDAIAGRKIDHAGTDGDDLAGPFMPGCERIGGRPGAREVASDDLRIAAADRHRAYLA